MSGVLKLSTLVLLLVVVTLSGCTMMADVQEVACANLEDKDHCYQDAAIRWTQPETCNKVQRLAPQSKCWMLIAEKTANVNYCDRMKMGEGTYDQEQCLMLVAIKTQDPRVCEKMGNYQHSWGNDVTPGPINKEACLDKVFARCGKEGGACCAGNICDISLSCKKEEGKPSVCARIQEGGEGQRCYSNAEGWLACNANLTCSSKGLCVTSCGYANQPCCNNNSIDHYFECSVPLNYPKTDHVCINDICVVVQGTSSAK